jgi:hypothetical protein
MNEFKGTKGKWYVDEINTRRNKYNALCTSIRTNSDYGFAEVFGEDETAKANALLIAEAGNIRQQIPFSLTELKRQRDEMLEMLNSIAENYKSGNEDNFIMSNLIDKSENLIKEATQI